MTGQGEGSDRFTPVARLEDVPEGAVHVVEVGGQSILLCHSGGHVYAVINECSHMQERLDCGRMRYGWIACPVHGSRFDLETGEPMNPPADQPIKTFRTRIAGEWIEVEA